MYTKSIYFLPNQSIQHPTTLGFTHQNPLHRPIGSDKEETWYRKM